MWLCENKLQGNTTTYFLRIVLNRAKIDLFHNGGQINYSFVLMLISPTNLATTSKFQKNICFKARAAGLININTKECEVAIYESGLYPCICKHHR